MVHFVSLLDCMVRVQSFDDEADFVFVGDVNAHHSAGWSRSLLLIGLDVMLVIFAIC